MDIYGFMFFGSLAAIVVLLVLNILHRKSVSDQIQELLAEINSSLHTNLSTQVDLTAKNTNTTVSPV